MIDWLGYALGAIAVVCLILPPRYDPGIRLKMWMEGWNT
jgi:hypothetical protein